MKPYQQVNHQTYPLNNYISNSLTTSSYNTNVSDNSSKAFHHNKKATYLKHVGTYFDPKICPI
jgi:hypothetical protein